MKRSVFFMAMASEVTPNAYAYTKIIFRRSSSAPEILRFLSR